MTKALTQRQRQILDFIASEVEFKGYPPSVREIGSAIGLSSSSTVHSHLAALERKGLIKRDPSKPRALLLADRARPADAKTVGVPLVGHVAAGQPILAEENIENTLAWPAGIGSAPTFALRVKGDSMIENGIFDGDIVMVRHQDTAENGETVVAMIDGEATVKRLNREQGRVRLDPANIAYKPIYSDDVTILGKVVGLLRQF
jgi:repressor LexA